MRSGKKLFCQRQILRNFTDRFLSPRLCLGLLFRIESLRKLDACNLQFTKYACCFLYVNLKRQVVQGFRNRQIGFNGCQFFTQECCLPANQSRILFLCQVPDRISLDSKLLFPCICNVGIPCLPIGVQRLVQGADRLVTCNQGYRSCRTDSRNALDIVGAVSHQSLQCCNRRRLYTKLCLNPFRIERKYLLRTITRFFLYSVFLKEFICFCLRRMKHPNRRLIRSKLQIIVILCHNADRYFTLEFLCKGAAEIIGLIMAITILTHAHTLQYFLHGCKLLGKRLHRFAPVRLIIRIHFAAESISGQVPGNREVFGILLLHNTKQRPQKAVNAIRIAAFRCFHNFMVKFFPLFDCLRRQNLTRQIAVELRRQKAGTIDNQ